MDYKLYYKLLSFRSYSNSKRQIEFRNWLKVYIEENIPNTITKVDKYGNLYVTKGDAEIYNCVIAHLDINQSIIKESNVELHNVNGWIVGLDKSTGKQCGVGHDDKAGVYFNLEMLKHFDNIKAFFPLDEEVGCVGTKHADKSFFENVGFMVQLDRRGYKDISTYSNGNELLTEETQKLLSKTLSTFGFAFTTTILTDVGELVGDYGIQGTNISCGYYDEHSDQERLNVSQFQNSIAFARSVLEVMDGKKHEIKQPARKKYGYASYYGGWDDWYDNIDVGVYEDKPITDPNAPRFYIDSVSGDFFTLDELVMLEDVVEVEQILWEHLNIILEWYGDDDEALRKELIKLEDAIKAIKAVFLESELLIEYDIKYKLKNLKQYENFKK